MQELIGRIKNFRITLPRPGTIIGWMVSRGVGVHTHGLEPYYSEICYPCGSERFGHDRDRIYVLSLYSGDWRAWDPHEVYFCFESTIGLSPETLELVVRDLSACPLDEAVRAVETIQAIENKPDAWDDMTDQEVNALRWYLLERSHPRCESSASARS